jgi:hypothetical protein
MIIVHHLDRQQAKRRRVPGLGLQWIILGEGRYRLNQVR